MSSSGPGRNVVGDSASSATWTLASRITGFARVVLVGVVLGASFVGNLFQLANQLPWLVFEVTVGSLLGALIVPALMAHIAPTASNSDGEVSDPEALADLGGAFAVAIAAGFAIVAALVMVASPLVARLFAVGMPDDVRSHAIGAALPLVLLTAPQLIGYGLTVTAQSIQQAMGSFAFPAAASIVENLAVIITLVAYALVFETSTSISAFDGPRIALLGIGSSIGVSLHVILQWWGVRRLGLRPRWSAGWRHPEVQAVFARALPASGSAALNGLRILTLLILANSVAGGVVALQLGLNLIGVAVALGAKPVAYAVLPRLAVRFQANELGAYRDEYERGVGLAALIVVPAAVGALVFGWLLGPTLAVGAMGTDDGRLLLAVTVSGIAGAVAGEAFHQLGVAGSYGREQTRPPLVAFALRLGFTIVAVPLAWMFDGPARIAVLAGVMSAADLLSGILLHRWVLRGLPSVATDGYQLTRSLLRTTGASIIGFGLAAVAAVLVMTAAQGRLVEVTVVAVGSAIGAALAFVLRNRADDELTNVASQLRGAR